MASKDKGVRKRSRDNYFGFSSDGDGPKSLSSVDGMSEISLSTQQEQLISAIATGKSVFITGSAGTGKSFLLRHAVSTLRRLHYPNSVFVTASTGVAACALGGLLLRRRWVRKRYQKRTNLLCP
ncbi:hypothetical protein ZOSMA_185G00210 [Zostera marina]|uniref:ATP-dependent DNA helicase n=1 Tax=Zostera marina TaxID=29655 RepID=A0A0K9PSK9_ZOSMR|nr:hypothetical protein ZOSMA_185G00210 [Zostera marina]